MNYFRAWEAAQKKENLKFTEFFTPILTIFLYLEVSEKIHLHFKWLDTKYPEANSHLGAILSILTRLKDKRINLTLIYILLNSIRDKKIAKPRGQCLQKCFLFQAQCNKMVLLY